MCKSIHVSLLKGETQVKLPKEPFSLHLRSKGLGFRLSHASSNLIPRVKPALRHAFINKKKSQLVSDVGLVGFQKEISESKFIGSIKWLH
jgi:hypothetical protein